MGEVPTVNEATLAAPAAADQRSFLSALLDSLDTGVMACDAEGAVVLINRSLRQVYRLPPDWDPADLPAALATLRLPDGTPMARDQSPLLRRAAAGERIRDLDMVIAAEGAQRRVFTANAEPIVDAVGNGHGAVIALHEVTRQRRRERFHSCELAVATALTEATTATEAGCGALEIIGQHLGWPYGELWLVDAVSAALRPAARWLAPGRDLSGHVPDTLVRGQGLAGRAWADRQSIWLPDIATDHPTLAATAASFGLHTAIAVPLPGDGNADGPGVFVYFASVDEPPDAVLELLESVSARVGHFLTRRRADELALQVARGKDDFLSLVGHEMRTPLTSIASYVDLLLTDGDARPDQDRQLLEVIARNTHSLQCVIDALLDLAAMESGHRTLHTTQVDLVRIARDALGTAEPTAAANGVTLTAALPDTLTVSGDPQRLRQLLDSLLSNAVKYSPAGGSVTVTAVPDGSVVTLAVADTGIGIPAAERGQLFQRFFRASNVRHSAIAGTGLGLAVARAIVEAHHGAIALDERSATGTTITVRLPAS